MKAVVLEVKGNTAAVLKEDGTIEKINRVCQVGEEIVLEEKAKIKAFPKKYLAIAASLALVIILGSSGLVYASPASYVTMDAKLSFEFALNAFDEVVSMKALNKEGEQIADDFNSLSSFHPTLNEAITLTSELLYNSNYLGNENSNNIIISAVSSNDEKSFLLSETAKNALNEVSTKYGTIAGVATAIGTTEMRNQAITEGVSTGQYIMETSNSKKGGIYGDEKQAISEKSIASTNSTTEGSDVDATTPEASQKEVVASEEPTNSTVATEPAAVPSSDSSEKDGSTATDKPKNAPAINSGDKNAPAISNNDKNSPKAAVSNKKEADNKENKTESTK